MCSHAGSGLPSVNTLSASAYAARYAPSELQGWHPDRVPKPSRWGGGMNRNKIRNEDR